MVYLLSMKELEKVKWKEAQLRLFSYAVFQRGWEREGMEVLSLTELPQQAYKGKILRGEHGKPYIEGNPFYFNLSHSGEYLVMGFSMQPLGIDIQKLRQVKSIESVAKRFAEEEREEIIKGGMESFFRIWCRKEAYGKCIGTGLTWEILKKNLLHGAKDCLFEELSPPEGYRLCLCRLLHRI